jgi:hypothetical protein
VHKRPFLGLLDLQLEEESQFSHHAHLKFPAHSIYKLGNKCMRRATKNDIIHVYLNQESVSALLEEKQSFINRILKTYQAIKLSNAYTRLSKLVLDHTRLCGV